MPGFPIRIDIDARALSGGLAALEKEGQDPSGAWDVIGRRWADQVRDNFAAQKSPEGVPWTPSARAKLEDGQTLVKSAALRDSITSEPDATGVSIGTNKVYAAVHQFGATIVPVVKKFLRFVVPGGREVLVKKVTIPPRPFLGVAPDWIAEWSEILAARLERMVQSGGASGASA